MGQPGKYSHRRMRLSARIGIGQRALPGPCAQNTLGNAVNITDSLEKFNGFFSQRQHSDGETKKKILAFPESIHYIFATIVDTINYCHFIFSLNEIESNGTTQASSGLATFTDGYRPDPSND